MAIQKYDTDKVLYGARRIHTGNDNINRAVDDLRSLIRKLGSEWVSRAGEKAQTSGYQLLQNNEARSAVLESYAAALEQGVSPSYESAEQHNTTLADQFK